MGSCILMATVSALSFEMKDKWIFCKEKDETLSGRDKCFHNIYHLWVKNSYTSHILHYILFSAFSPCFDPEVLFLQIVI